MNEGRTLQGKWYLPDSPKELFGGTFYYSREEGCYIEIIGSFEGFMPASRWKEIILGDTIGAGKVTLVQCRRASYKANMTGVIVSRYSATFALVGDHFESIDVIKFDRLRASIADLEDWVGIYGVNKLELNFTAKAIDINYQSPDSQYHKVKDNVQIGFEFEYTFPIVKQIANPHITQRTFLAITSVEQLPFKELLNYFFVLYKFLILAYYDSPHILSIQLKNSSNEEHEVFNVELFYSDHFFNKRYKAGKEFYEYLFTYQQVIADLPSVIELWFSLNEVISPAVSLFTDLLLKREYGLELKFLVAIQAVETFHRNIYGGKEVPKEEHEEKMRLILERVPENLQGWLKEKLAFSNEPSLRKRLTDLYDRIPEEVTGKLIKNKKGFINGVVKTRNYYTHYDPALKKHIMPHSEVSKTVEKLKVFLICLILNELSLTREQIVNIVQLDKVYPFAEI